MEHRLIYRLRVRDSFAAAHQLREYEGACERLHGHNWDVEVEVEGERLNGQGLLVDFKVLKAILREVLDPLDHSMLNEHPAFSEENPTSERLAQYIIEEMEERLKEISPQVRVSQVSVWESPNSRAIAVRKSRGTPRTGGAY